MALSRKYEEIALQIAEKQKIDLFDTPEKVTKEVLLEFCERFLAALPKPEPVGVFADVNALIPEAGTRWEHMVDEAYNPSEGYIYLYSEAPISEAKPASEQKITAQDVAEWKTLGYLIPIWRMLPDGAKAYCQCCGSPSSDVGGWYGFTVCRSCYDSTPASEQKLVAWVDVIDRHEGPYNFNGMELLDSGKHLLYTAPPVTPDKVAVLVEALSEIVSRIKDHPAYAELTESEESEVGGDTAEFSYLARVGDAALSAAKE